ncbi:DUF4913 domain-containing protein (plasmid) [Arthrobacter sp. G.S.26]|uniref:DUF4913 domain-containing protein n=1 Tax=Arthrobacter sp. G.S.26 TaxID=3433706 RepID=UPI003D786609
MLPTYVRDVDGRAAKWCIEWYFHPDAVSRVEALWRAWEHLRLDGATGISVWFKDHADHHITPSSTHAGPFTNATCKNTETPNTSNPKKPHKVGSQTRETRPSERNRQPLGPSLVESGKHTSTPIRSVVRRETRRRVRSRSYHDQRKSSDLIWIRVSVSVEWMGWGSVCEAS